MVEEEFGIWLVSNIPPILRVIVPVPVVMQAAFLVVVLPWEAQVQRDILAVAVGVFVEFDAFAEGREAMSPYDLTLRVGHHDRRAQMVGVDGVNFERWGCLTHDGIDKTRSSVVRRTGDFAALGGGAGEGVGERFLGLNVSKCVGRQDSAGPGVGGQFLGSRVPRHRSVVLFGLFHQFPHARRPVGGWGIMIAVGNRYYTFAVGNRSYIGAEIFAVGNRSYIGGGRDRNIAPRIVFSCAVHTAIIIVRAFRSKGILRLRGRCIIRG